MVKPKGGRGITAPYETTHVRVPVPIKEKVQKLIDDYRNSLLNDGDKFIASEDNNVSSDDRFVDLSDVILLAKEILCQRKSARISMAKLLTGIYGKEIKPKDL